MTDLRLVATLRVGYKMGSVDERALRHMLKRAVDRVLGEGMLTGETDAEVEYSFLEVRRGGGG